MKKGPNKLETNRRRGRGYDWTGELKNQRAKLKEETKKEKRDSDYDPQEFVGCFLNHPKGECDCE